VEGGVHLAVVAAGKDNVQAPEAYITSERRIGVRVSETGFQDMSQFSLCRFRQKGNQSESWSVDLIVAREDEKLCKLR
jgi:hypothetical protein